MLKPVDIVMAGVGGQGTILATNVLAQAAMESGYDIKVSEVHGMAQRGGSVITQVRLGDQVFSPLIAAGTADLLLAFEKLEALRYLPYLKEGGALIVNTQEVLPVPVLAGLALYPENIIDYLRAAVPDMVAVNALDLAVQCGHPRTANMVLLGILARRLPISREAWDAALAWRVPARYLAENKEAFSEGYKL